MHKHIPLPRGRGSVSFSTPATALPIRAAISPVRDGISPVRDAISLSRDREGAEGEPHLDA